MRLHTLSITGDAIMAALAGWQVGLPDSACCEFVRVDQNTREILIDYSIDGEAEPRAGESYWRPVERSYRKIDVWNGFQKLEKQIRSSTRTPNPRPWGCSEEWYTSK